MSVINVRLNRLNITLHGVSAQIVEAAIDGLDHALYERIGRAGLNCITSCDLSELSASPIQVNHRLDPAALRGLIADRLLDMLQRLSQGVRD
jgi:hypothetical protein